MNIMWIAGPLAIRPNAVIRNSNEITAQLAGVNLKRMNNPFAPFAPGLKTPVFLVETGVSSFFGFSPL